MRPELPVLIKARALIADPAKWGKGKRGCLGDRPLDTCCAAEAIEEVEPPSPRRRAAYYALERAAGLVRPPMGSAIVEWNDAPERTHAEVLAAFDKAIAHTTGERDG